MTDDPGEHRRPRFSGSSWLPAWFRESGVLIASQMSSVVTGSLLLILIARELGPERLGLFATFFGVAQAGTHVVELGLTTWLLRELTAIDGPGNATDDAPRRRSDVMSSAVGLSSLMTALLLGGGAVAVVVIGLSTEESAALLALLGYSALLAVSLVLEVGFRARRQVRRFAIATLLEKGALVALVGAAVALHKGVLAICAGYLVAGAARLTYDVRKLRASDGIALTRPSRSSLWQATRAASPFALNTAMVALLPRLDVVFVATTTTIAAGYYAVADRTLAGLLVVPVMALLALYPHLAGRPERLRQTWKLALGLALPVAAVAGLASLFALEIVRALFGERYESAAPVLQILLLSAPALVYGHVLLASLFIEGQEKAVVVCLALSMLVGTGLFVAGLALDGITGAAWGAVARAFLFALAVFGFGRRRARNGARRRPACATGDAS